MVESVCLQNIPNSKLWNIANKAITLTEQGYDVIRLELGRPDFDTPVHIKEAAKKALDEGKVHYVSHFGIRPLREAIAERWELETGRKIDPDKNILITEGGTEGLFISYAAFLNPGDEILIGDPGWITYFFAPLLFGNVIKNFPLIHNGEFRIDIELIKSMITPKTRMIVLNSPNNPTGGVFNREEVEALAELCLSRGIMIISDEVYHRLMFGNNKHYSFAALDGMEEHVITVDSFSKTYSMTGWRLGYVIASEKNILSLLRAHQQLGATCCSFGQYGAVEALRGDQDCVEQMRKAYEKRKNIIIGELGKMECFSFIEPKAGLYIYLNVSKTGMTGSEFANKFLEQEKVALMPGDAFGDTGKDWVRVSIANTEENLQKAMMRLKNFIM